jgi:hypothetical protein
MAALTPPADQVHPSERLSRNQRLVPLLRRAQSLFVWLLMLGSLVLILITGVINDYRSQYSALTVLASIVLMMVCAAWLMRRAIERLE